MEPPEEVRQTLRNRPDRPRTAQTEQGPRQGDISQTDMSSTNFTRDTRLYPLCARGVRLSYPTFFLQGNPLRVAAVTHMQSYTFACISMLHTLCGKIGKSLHEAAPNTYPFGLRALVEPVLHISIPFTPFPVLHARISVGGVPWLSS